jgi:hypothetical protein
MFLFLLYVASSSILSFRYSLFLFLKCLGVLNVAVSNVCGWASWSFLILHACPTVLEFLNPFVFQLLVHLQITKNGSQHAVLPRCKQSGAAILLCHSAKLNCVMILKLSTSRDKSSICWHLCTESCTANPWQIKTCVQILIDLPLYSSLNYQTQQAYKISLKYKAVMWTVVLIWNI